LKLNPPRRLGRRYPGSVVDTCSGSTQFLISVTINGLVPVYFHSSCFGSAYFNSAYFNSTQFNSACYGKCSTSRCTKFSSSITQTFCMPLALGLCSVELGTLDIIYAWNELRSSASQRCSLLPHRAHFPRAHFHTTPTFAPRARPAPGHVRTAPTSGCQCTRVIIVATDR